MARVETSIRKGGAYRGIQLNKGTHTTPALSNKERKELLLLANILFNMYLCRTLSMEATTAIQQGATYVADCTRLASP